MINKHIQGIHHVAVSVPDIDIARKFYVDLLGFTEVCYAEWEAGNVLFDEILGLKDSAGKSFIARGPNTYIEVFEYLSPTPRPQEAMRPVNEYGYTHFCLQVDDIEAVHKRLLEAGIKFHTAPEPVALDAAGNKEGFSATYGRDFFGNVFEIIEINDGAEIQAL